MLRRKMEDMEGENERLGREVLELQEVVKTSQSCGDPKTPKTLEKEMAKLKMDLMEKNKEIEHLNEALTQAEKNKGKVVMQRSRSLEGESSLDLKVSATTTNVCFCCMTLELQYPPVVSDRPITLRVKLRCSKCSISVHFSRNTMKFA